MAGTTANLVLDLFDEAQPNAHVKINEALRWLDAMVPQPSVIDRDLLGPPGSPTEGDLYQVALTGARTGAWSSFANGDLALFFDGSWHNKTPKEGWTIYVKDEDVHLKFNGTTWAAV